MIFQFKYYGEYGQKKSILRYYAFNFYKKEKRDITKVNYEPWHWRYVGVEHAKEINKLDMCLEEYLEHIS